jgi:hypothetical protein
MGFTLTGFPALPPEKLHWVREYRRLALQGEMLPVVNIAKGAE